MKHKVVDFLKQLMLLSVGSFICVVAVKCFLFPNGFVARGFTGLAFLIYYKFPICDVGLIYLIINIPVFILGWRYVSLRFVLYSILGMAIYSFMLTVVTYVPKVDDMMLSAAIAGAISGIGTAILLRSYGSCGGVEIICVILYKYFNITLGHGSMIINALILVLSVLMFPIQLVLYVLVYIAVSMQATNMAFHGLSKRQAILIISEKWRDIAEALKHKHLCGATLINGYGAYKGADKTILYTVIPRKKTSAVKRTVLDEDGNAFMAIMDADDVTGLEIGNQPHW